MRATAFPRPGFDAPEQCLRRTCILGLEESERRRIVLVHFLMQAIVDRRDATDDTALAHREQELDISVCEERVCSGREAFALGHAQRRDPMWIEAVPRVRVVDESAEIALRTQQVLMEETGVVNVADPLGGSWYLEALTDRLEQEAEEIFARIRALGSDGTMMSGILHGIETGWFSEEIAGAICPNPEGVYWYTRSSVTVSPTLTSAVLPSMRSCRETPARLPSAARARSIRRGKSTAQRWGGVYGQWLKQSLHW